MQIPVLARHWNLDLWCQRKSRAGTIDAIGYGAFLWFSAAPRRRRPFPVSVADTAGWIGAIALLGLARAGSGGDGVD